jgi:hypothetical protein
MPKYMNTSPGPRVVNVKAKEGEASQVTILPGRVSEDITLLDPDNAKLYGVVPEGDGKKLGAQPAPTPEEQAEAPDVKLAFDLAKEAGDRLSDKSGLSEGEEGWEEGEEDGGARRSSSKAGSKAKRG